MNASRPTGNRLLDILPETEYARLQGNMSPVHLEQGHVVYRAGEEIESVYFPSGCVLSAVAVMMDGTGVETGNIGLEGIGGIQVALSVGRIPSEMICQISGDAFRMAASTFSRMIDELPQFRLVVQRYTQSFMNLMGQSVACNRLHNLTERAARWLLMARDRVQGNEFYLTHEFLAYMLGVRRSGVTVAAGTLSQAGLIAYKRGKITILDPAGLEATACECYRIIVEDFERVFEMTRRELDEQSAAGSM